MPHFNTGDQTHAPKMAVTNVLSFDNEVFSSFAFHTGVVLLKMFFLGLYTPLMRRKKKVSRPTFSAFSLVVNIGVSLLLVKMWVILYSIQYYTDLLNGYYCTTTS